MGFSSQAENPNLFLVRNDTIFFYNKNGEVAFTNNSEILSEGYREENQLEEIGQNFVRTNLPFDTTYYFPFNVSFAHQFADGTIAVYGIDSSTTFIVNEEVGQSEPGSQVVTYAIFSGGYISFLNSNGNISVLENIGGSFQMNYVLESVQQYDEAFFTNLTTEDIKVNFELTQLSDPLNPPQYLQGNNGWSFKVSRQDFESQMVIWEEPKRNLLNHLYPTNNFFRENLVDQFKIWSADSISLTNVGIVGWQDAMGDNSGTFSGEFTLVSTDTRTGRLRIHYRAIDPSDGLALGNSVSWNPIWAEDEEVYHLTGTNMMIYNPLDMSTSLPTGYTEDNHDIARVPNVPDWSLGVTVYFMETLGGLRFKTFAPHIWSDSLRTKIYEISDIPTDIQGSCAWRPYGTPGSQDQPTWADLDHANGWDLIWLEFKKLGLVIKSARSTNPYPIQVWMIDLEAGRDIFLRQLSLELSAMTGPGQHDISFIEGNAKSDGSLTVEWFDNNIISCTQSVSYGKVAKIFWNSQNFDNATFYSENRSAMPIGPSSSRGSNDVFFVATDTFTIVNAGSHPIPSHLRNDSIYGNKWNLNNPPKAIFKNQDDFFENELVGIIQSIQPDPERNGDSTLFRDAVSYRTSGMNSLFFPDYDLIPTVDSLVEIGGELFFPVHWDSLPDTSMATCWHMNLNVLAKDTIYIPKLLVEQEPEFMLYTTIKLKQYFDNYNWIGRIQSRDWNIKWSVGDIISSVAEENDYEILIYPNPAQDFIRIKGVSYGFTIEILDITGKKILIQKTNEEMESINISFLPKGMYWINIILNEFESTTKSQKFIKM
jgi:hypothetical protein